MKPAKRAQTGPRPSSPGELGAASIETPAVTMVVKGTAAEAETAEVAPVGGATMEAETVEVVPMEAAVTAVEAAEVAETAEAGTASGEAAVVGPATVEVGVASPAAVEADEAANGLLAIVEEVVGIGGEATKVGAELGYGSSSSFRYEDSEEESEETVSEMRSEGGLDEASPTVELEARPVDPLIAQFGEDDRWWRNTVDFVRREAEGSARDPPDY